MIPIVPLVSIEISGDELYNRKLVEFDSRGSNWALDPMLSIIALNVT